MVKYQIFPAVYAQFAPKRKRNVNIFWLHIAHYLGVQANLFKRSNINQLLYTYFAEVIKNI